MQPVGCSSIHGFSTFIKCTFAKKRICWMYCTKKGDIFIHIRYNKSGFQKARMPIMYYQTANIYYRMKADTRGFDPLDEQTAVRIKQNMSGGV